MMRLFSIIVIFSLIVDNSFSLSIGKHGNKINSIPSDDFLWFSDGTFPEPKIGETLALSSSSSKSSSSSSSSSSVTYDDEEKHVNSNSNSEDGLPIKSFSSSSSESRPVISLKNSSEAIPFTRVDATLSIDGFKRPDSSSSDNEEEGVGPSVSFEYGSDYAESETGYSSPPSSSSVGPEDENNFETGDLKIEISDLKPVYIKPPSGFKPVLYPNREMDGIHPMGSSFLNDYQPSSTSLKPKVTLPPPKEPYPYPYPFGLTSWTLGGIRGIQRGGFWESMGSDTALGLPMRPFKGNPVSVVEWINLSDGSKIANNNNYKPPLPPPVISSHHSSSQEVASLSPTSSSKLPLSSWVFGGLRQFSPLTWQMPPMVIEKVEYVPLSSSSSPSSSSSSPESPNMNSYWIISDNEPSPVE